LQECFDPEPGAVSGIEVGMSNPPPKPLFDREMWTIVDKRGRIVCAGKDPLIYSVRREAWLDCEDDATASPACGWW
jgi:hypothetical protein